MNTLKTASPQTYINLFGVKAIGIFSRASFNYDTLSCLVRIIAFGRTCIYALANQQVRRHLVHKSSLTELHLGK